MSHKRRKREGSALIWKSCFPLLLSPEKLPTSMRLERVEQPGKSSVLKRTGQRATGAHGKHSMEMVGLEKECTLSCPDHALSSGEDGKFSPSKCQAKLTPKQDEVNIHHGL